MVGGAIMRVKFHHSISSNEEVIKAGTEIQTHAWIDTIRPQNFLCGGVKSMTFVEIT